MKNPILESKLAPATCHAVIPSKSASSANVHSSFAVLYSVIFSLAPAFFNNSITGKILIKFQ